MIDTMNNNISRVIYGPSGDRPVIEVPAPGLYLYVVMNNSLALPARFAKRISRE